MLKLLLVIFVSGCLVLLASCRQETETPPAKLIHEREAPPAKLTKDIGLDIPKILLREIPETDSRLGIRFTNQEAGFSIRPPAGWVSLTPKELRSVTEEAARAVRDLGTDKAPPAYLAYFREADTDNSLNIIKRDNGPSSLTLIGLIGFKENHVAAIRTLMGDRARIGSAEVFRFNGFKAVQIVTYFPDIITLNLLLFRQPRIYYQLTYSVEENQYNNISKAIEASIASFRLAETKTEQDQIKNEK